MTKTQATELLNFIRHNFDCVFQEDWFGLCDKLLEIIEHDANQQGYGRSLAKEFPEFFTMG